MVIVDCCLLIIACIAMICMYIGCIAMLDDEYDDGRRYTNAANTPTSDIMMVDDILMPPTRQLVI